MLTRKYSYPASEPTTCQFCSAPTFATWDTWVQHALAVHIAGLTDENPELYDIATKARQPQPPATPSA